MLYTEEIQFSRLAIHKVGNKTQNEPLQLSNSLTPIQEDIKELLGHYFLKPFQSEEYYQFHHPSSLELNEVYTFVHQLFQQKELLFEKSIALANYLYACQTHPNIKGGEFYVVYFQDCILDGEQIDAVGLFKSETKEPFLKVLPNEDNFNIESEQGININKLDKGCLILNTEQESGYVVSVVDKTNKQAEARYWVDDFLQIIQKENNYFQTEGNLQLYKSFVTEQLPKEYDIEKVDQVDLLNKTLTYFKENEEFQQEKFQTEVLAQAEVIESFTAYKKKYEQERNIHLQDDFSIHDAAVKRQNRNYKSVLKLDKNFHVYIHGDRSQIERGEDENGKYYKLYYKEEL